MSAKTPVLVRSNHMALAPESKVATENGIKFIKTWFYIFSLFKRDIQHHKIINGRSFSSCKIHPQASQLKGDTGSHSPLWSQGPQKVSLLDGYLYYPEMTGFSQYFSLWP